MTVLNNGYTYREQVSTEANGQPVLTYLVSRYRHSGEAAWRERLERGEVLLDGVPASGAELLRAGQVLIWNRPSWQEENVPRHYDLIFRDELLIAVNKPSGLPTLPGGGFLHNTLLGAVREHFPEARPLHRLGRGTSGLVLFARTRGAAAAMSEAWRKRQVEKRYRALAEGVAEREQYEIAVPVGPVPHPMLGTVHAASPGGKPALSVARVLERREEATLFEVDIHTGRPHQIRIHLAHAGHPLLGDPLYAPGGVPKGEEHGADLPGLPGDGGYLLHAHTLGFEHPVTGERLELQAPPPPILKRAGEP